MAMAPDDQLDAGEPMITAYSREDAVAAVKEALGRLSAVDASTVLDLSVHVGQELFSCKDTMAEDRIEVRRPEGGSRVVDEIFPSRNFANYLFSISRNNFVYREIFVTKLNFSQGKIHF
jgi:hypothetical protein